MSIATLKVEEYLSIMNYVVLFPECENVHLTKDVGMIPYIMKKKFGYQGYVACYRNEESYSYLHKEVKGLDLCFIPKITGRARWDGLFWLLRKAKKIDVLQLFHFTSSRNFLWIFFYKLLNHNGQVYLKLDFDSSILEYRIDGWKNTFKRRMLEKCDIISIETLENAKKLSEKWEIAVQCISNGYYAPLDEFVIPEEKEKIICTVGSIGIYRKNVEMLLEAFQIFAAKNGEWKLRVIGEIEEKFKGYIDNYYAVSGLNDRVIFTGKIEDREKLYSEYCRASIFCLTSRAEGYALVYLEALNAGCYIVTTNVDCARDVTDNEKYGSIVPIGDVDTLTDTLFKVCDDNNLLYEKCIERQKYVRNKFSWDRNCEKIVNMLEKEGR